MSSSLIPGTRLGPYEVLDPIGAGGMGEVYRARDTRLKRQVALKVLPPGVTGDPDRMVRFQREAEVLASLNHPNIAALYGMEDGGDVKALVMELVEGPTLADRIAQGAIPTSEALATAGQIAHALAAAHDQGIIHRDLKPANIKLRSDGDVKVLDFGLAKALEPASAPTAGLSMSPTITSPAQMTAAGMILGTAAYMSPEQAAGRVVDRRTDLWAFGVVLLEMLSGKRVFDGETVSHVIASVLKDDPDWTALPSDTPAAVRKLLRRCLEKDRRKRLSDTATAAFECEDALQPAQQESPAKPLPPSATWRWWPAVAGLAAGALIAAVIAWRAWPAPPETTARNIRFSVVLPKDLSFTRSGRHVLALSPDGTHLAFVANQQLYLRPLRALEAAPIQGTAKADPSEPVFSPDGQWIAFWSDGRLKKIPITGGTAMTLASIGNPFGISWSGERIVFGQEDPRAIVEVPANGGALTTLLAVDAAKDEWVQSPQLLNDGRAVLFTLRTGDGDWNDSTVVIQDLVTGERATLVQGGTDGRALPGGWLAYARGDTLFVIRFDAERRSVSGSAVPLEVGVLQSLAGLSGASQAAWSSSGTLAIVPDTFGADRSLVWMTRQGAVQPTQLPPRRLWERSLPVALSPDGKCVAARIMGSSATESDIWIGDLTRNTFTRLTVSGRATDPVWTPDGTRVCYVSAESLFCQRFDGSEPPQSLFRKAGLSAITSIAPDGASLILSMNGESSSDLWLAPNKPPYEATPLIVTGRSATVSPDGRWIAYASGPEIDVQPFPAVSKGRWQVSDAGGIVARWAPDGRTIYYLSTGTAGSNLIFSLVAVPVMPGPSFTLGSPVTIARLNTGARLLDVARDGRVLLSMVTGDVTGRRDEQRIVVVHNWPDALP